MPMFDGLNQRRRGAEIEAAVSVDFTGGLNTGLSEQAMAGNEVRGCLNVNFLRSGGVERRNPVMPFAYDMGNLTGPMVPYVNSSGTMTMLADPSGAGNVYQISPPYGGVTDLGFSIGNVAIHGFQVGEYIYLNRRDNPGPWIRWDGTTDTTMGFSLRDDSEDFEGTGLPDFSSYDNGGIPRAREAVTWNGRVWVANIRQSGDVYDAGAVYWSFSFGIGDLEGQEDFYENWAFRFDGVDGLADEVLRLIPLNDRLLVFGTRSVHAIYANLEYPELLYRTERVQSRLGLVGANAVAADSAGVWFLDGEQGLLHISTDGEITGHMKGLESTFRTQWELNDESCVGVWDNVVYVGTGGLTWVYDSLTGAWTKWSLPFKDFTPYFGSDFGGENSTLVGRLEDPIDCYVDVTGKTVQYPEAHALDSFSDTENADFDSFVETHWFDADFTEAVKTWKGLELVFRVLTGQGMKVQAFTDWNDRKLQKQWDIEDASSQWAHQENTFNETAWYLLLSGMTYPTYGSVSPALATEYVEYSVLDATERPRAARRGEDYVPDLADPLLEAEVAMDRLPESTFLDGFGAGRSISLRIEPDSSSGKWGLDRLAVYFQRNPVRT